MHVEEVNLNFLSLNYNNKPNKIILHEAKAKTCTVFDMNLIHKKMKKSGLGYHYYITKDGKIWRGRREEAQGGHCKGQNRESIGICFEGDFDKEKMEKVQLDAGIELINEIKSRRGKMPVFGADEFLGDGVLGKFFPLSELQQAKMEKKEEPIQVNQESEFTPIIPVNPIAQPTPVVETAAAEEPVVTVKEPEKIFTQAAAPSAQSIPNASMVTNSSNYKISYSSYVTNKGWISTVGDGDTSGYPGENNRIEAVSINYSGVGNIEFQCFFANAGWQSIRYSGEIAGTVGRDDKIIEAISIELKDSTDSIEYRVFTGNNWMPWVPGGVMAGNIGRGQHIEAIEVRIK